MKMTVECATDGCATIFQKRSNRHKYCDECRAARKKGYYKEWYYNRGGANHLKEKYNHEYAMLYRERSRGYYYERGGREKQRAWNATPKAQLARRKRDVALLQAKRESRVIEMMEGGRPFRLRNAPVSGSHLTGIADYQAGTTKFKQVDHPKKPAKVVVDKYAWDGSVRERINR